MTASTMFWRLVWKEYRVQRSFWGAVLAIGLMFHFGLFVFGDVAPGNLHAISFMIVILYVFGSAGILFSGEREAGTDRYLQVMPLSVPVLFSAKALFLAGSALFVGLLLTFSALVFELLSNTSGVRGPEGWEFTVAAGIVIFGGGFVLWTTTISLASARVMRTLGWTALAYLLSCMGIAYLLFLVGISGGSHENAFLCTFGALDAVLCVAVVGLTVRWLRPTFGGSLDGTHLLPERIGWKQPFALDAAQAKPMAASPAGRWLSAQLWLEFRHARWFVCGYFVVFAGLTVLVQVNRNWDAPPEQEWHTFVIWWYWIVIVTSVLAGCQTFLGEQAQDRFRFQINRGVSPVALWWTKIGVWAVITLTLQAGLLAFTYVVLQPEIQVASSGAFLQHFMPGSGLILFQQLGLLGTSWASGLGLTLLISLIGFAIGQCASLLMKRSLMVYAIAFMASLCACFWLIVHFVLGIPLLWAAAPPAVALLLLSLGRTQGWLLEQTDRRAWVRGGLAAAVLFLVVSGMSITLRVMQVPAATQSMAFVADVSQPSDAAEETLRLYQNAAEALTERPKTKQSQQPNITINGQKPAKAPSIHDDWNHASQPHREWAQSNARALELLLAAPARNDVPRLNERNEEVGVAFMGRVTEMQMLLRLRASQLESNDQLAAAWRIHHAQLRFAKHLAQASTFWNAWATQIRIRAHADVWRWSAHRQQTSELMLQAARDLAHEYTTFPKLESVFARRTALALQAVENRDRRLDPENVRDPLSPEVIFAHMPWEWTRLERLVRAVGTRDVLLARSLDQGNGRAYAPPDVGWKRSQPRWLDLLVPESQWRQPSQFSPGDSRLAALWEITPWFYSEEHIIPLGTWAGSEFDLRELDLELERRLSARLAFLCLASYQPVEHPRFSARLSRSANAALRTANRHRSAVIAIRGV